MTLDGVRELLAPHWTMLDAPQNIEFVIRETRAQAPAYNRGIDGLGSVAQ